MNLLLSRSLVKGPPNNLDFLNSIMLDSTFTAGNTLTSFLGDFDYNPGLIDVVSPGAYTLIQDLEGRPTVGKGMSVLLHRMCTLDARLTTVHL
jgi:hypothetical protein